MSQEFHAIYENGVLRPLAPLNLPPSAEVRGTLRVKHAPAKNGAPSAEELQRQQQALDAMFALADRLPQSPATDGLSGRDHDQILYGER